MHPDRRGATPARLFVERNKFCVSVEAYRLDAANSPERMRDLMQRTLAEFGLQGVVEY